MQSIQLPAAYVSHLEKQGFILKERLGQGLSGSVYLADQPRLGRQVAVKFFDSAFVRDDAAMRKRFSREAKLLSRIQHPSLPYVLTEGLVHATEWEAPYFVMEFIDGSTLQEILKRDHHIEQDVAIDYAIKVLDALGHAHAHNIVHRDVKPSNIMVNQRSQCFLIDFSIGVSFEATPGMTRATQTGYALGTTAYSSPEQLQDASKVDSRTDIYSMGIVLLEMLTGNSDRTNISRALSGVTRGVVNAIEMACAPNPSDRFKNAEEFARALGGGRQPRAPSLSPALAICSNIKCPGANWGERGYYRGPNVISESTDSFCTSCGEALIYQCSSCGIPISNTPFCGNCGTQTYRIPECKKCGSWLTREFMETEGANGCFKCKGKTASPIAAADFEDDIPF